MQTKKIIILLILAISSIIIIEGILYLENYRKTKNNTETKKIATITLEFWGTWDNSDSWEKIIGKFENESHIWNNQEVKININYTKKDISSYEKEIERGYSENKSPSIYMINNYWLERYADKLEPLSENFAIIKEYDLLERSDFTNIFPPYIREDVELDDKILALPIYSDSLALYYNKDLFEEAEIDTPPTTWEELKKDLKKLTISNRKGEIEQFGVSLGTGKNINRSCDIVSLLIMQGGGKVINEEQGIDINKKITFNTSKGTQEREPGITAIQFYMEFSDPAKEIYTWNNTTENSIEDFAEGKVAMMINYSYQIPNLLALKPELNYGIAPMPQIGNSTVVNITNTWIPVVSNQQSCVIESENDTNTINCANIAWSFLSFINKEENIIEYLDSANKASARIDISEKQSEEDNKISAFAKQTTSTRSYNKFDDEIDNIITEMLDNIYQNRTDWKNEIDSAVDRIEDLKK